MPLTIEKLRKVREMLEEHSLPADSSVAYVIVNGKPMVLYGNDERGWVDADGKPVEVKPLP